MKPPICVGSFSEKEALILEISFGEFDEENIVHPEEIYARAGLTSAKHTEDHPWMGFLRPTRLIGRATDP